MVEDSEMTDEQVLSSQLADQAMVEANAEPKQEMTKPPTSSRVGRIRMFNKLDSKLCMVTVLSYLISWEQAEKFFRCLNTRGQAYFNTHKEQFR